MRLWIAVAISFFFISSAFAGVSREYLEYGAEKIRLDVYNPGSMDCGVVILIHGAAGIESGDRAQRYKKFATDLMNKGFIAINVYYFDTQSRQWNKTIIEAVNYAGTIKNVDKGRIGLVGYSLGGTIALQVASADTRIKALAINSGYLPAGFTKEDARRLPVTFFASGSDDSAINTLKTLEAWFNESGKRIYTKINQGLGHDNVPMYIFEEDWNAILRFLTDNL